MGAGIIDLSQGQLFIDGQKINDFVTGEITIPEDNRCSNINLPVSGTMKVKIRIAKEPNRLINILKHTRKIRTKKKLFNRIYNKYRLCLLTMK